MGRGPGYRQHPQERQIKAAVLERDRGICYVCGLPGADQADHVVPVHKGGVHEMHNRRAIHSWPCHHDKTQREAREARMYRSNGRAKEAHPGLK